MRTLALSILATTILATACSGSGTEPSVASTLTIAAPSPGPGSSIPTIQRGIQYFVDRGSGLISIPITVTSDREVPYAALWVYLETGSNPEFCGLNLPDAPTWGPFEKGQTVSVTITGFQIFRVPCTVTKIHAYLHTRNLGLLTPPNASETVAQGARDVNLTFR